MKEQVEDKLRDGQTQAEVEKMIATATAQAQGAAMGGGGGGFGGDGDDGGEPASVTTVGSTPESRGHESRLRILERKLRQSPLKNGISERELFAGSREAEKRAGEKMDKLLKGNAAVARRVDEMSTMMREVVAAKRRVR